MAKKALVLLAILFFFMPYCAAGERELSLSWYLPFPSAVKHVEDTLYTLHPEDPGAFTDIAISNDCKALAFACTEMRCTSGVELIDLKLGGDLNIGGSHFPERIALAGEGKLVIGLEGRRIFAYDFSGGGAVPVSSFETDLGTLTRAFDVSRNGRYVLLADTTNLYLHSPYGAEFLKWHYGEGELLAASVSDAGNVVAVGNERGKRVMFLMNDEGVLLWKQELDTGGKVVADVSADGERIALGIRDELNRDFALYLYGGDGEFLFRHGVEAGPAEVALSGDGGVAALRPYEKKAVEVLDTESGEGQVYYTYSYPLHVAVSAGGDCVLASDIGYYGGSGRTRWSRLYLLDYSYRPVVETGSPKAAIIANDADFELASGLVDFLEGRNITVARGNLSEPASYSEAATVLVLGGPDAGEGVGGLVSTLLFDSEEEYLRTPGNRMKFVHTDLWSNGQRLFILAGSDRWQTQKVWGENLADIARQAGR